MKTPNTNSYSKSKSIMQYLNSEPKIALNLWKTSFPILITADVRFTNSNPDNSN